jgi:hypothetical protein
MAVMDGPLEPSSSTTSNVADVPDDPSFINFFSVCTIANTFLLFQIICYDGLFSFHFLYCLEMVLYLACLSYLCPLVPWYISAPRFLIFNHIHVKYFRLCRNSLLCLLMLENKGIELN